MRPDTMLCDLRIDGKQLRLAQRRDVEQTDTFRDQCRVRGGIEATNAMLKRITGLGRLRVRSRPAVCMSIQLKVAGWNLLRTASALSLMTKLQSSGQAAQIRRPWRTFQTSPATFRVSAAQTA